MRIPVPGIKTVAIIGAVGAGAYIIGKKVLELPVFETVGSKVGEHVARIRKDIALKIKPSKLGL